jgi:hypothetical protein
MNRPPEPSGPSGEVKARDRRSGSERNQDEPRGDRDLRRMAVVLQLEVARRVHRHSTARTV